MSPRSIDQMQPASKPLDLGPNALRVSADRSLLLQTRRESSRRSKFQRKQRKSDVLKSLERIQIEDSSDEGHSNEFHFARQSAACKPRMADQNNDQPEAAGLSLPNKYLRRGGMTGGVPLSKPGDTTSFLQPLYPASGSDRASSPEEAMHNAQMPLHMTVEHRGDSNGALPAKHPDSNGRKYSRRGSVTKYSLDVPATRQNLHGETCRQRMRRGSVTRYSLDSRDLGVAEALDRGKKGVDILEGDTSNEYPTTASVSGVPFVGPSVHSEKANDQYVRFRLAGQSGLPPKCLKPGDDFYSENLDDSRHTRKMTVDLSVEGNMHNLPSQSWHEQTVAAQEHPTKHDLLDERGQSKISTKKKQLFNRSRSVGEPRRQSTKVVPMGASLPTRVLRSITKRSVDSTLDQDNNVRKSENDQSSKEKGDVVRKANRSAKQVHAAKQDRQEEPGERKDKSNRVKSKNGTIGNPRGNPRSR